METMMFALIFPLLLLGTFAGKPTLEYGPIRRHNNGSPSTSTHPPPTNPSTRPCNVEDRCRHLTLSFYDLSGTRFEVNVTVHMGASSTSGEPGSEALAAAMAKWSLNNQSKISSRLLNVSLDSTASADSAENLHLEAVRRGIVRMGLQVQSRNAKMSTEDMASLPPVGNIVIRVDAAPTRRVNLKFFTQVKSLSETDIIQILEYAKAILPTIPT
ncbi:hypothetical protein PTKIN_Ptkin16aG0116600 [Pterospermum kingtungense]